MVGCGRGRILPSRDRRPRPAVRPPARVAARPAAAGGDGDFPARAGHHPAEHPHRRHPAVGGGDGEGLRRRPGQCAGAVLDRAVDPGRRGRRRPGPPAGPAGTGLRRPGLPRPPPRRRRPPHARHRRGGPHAARPGGGGPRRRRLCPHGPPGGAVPRLRPGRGEPARRRPAPHRRRPVRGVGHRTLLPQQFSAQRPRGGPGPAGDLLRRPAGRRAGGGLAGGRRWRTTCSASCRSSAACTAP